MLAEVGREDEEKWLAEGIAGLQQNAYYMGRALVWISPPLPSTSLSLSLSLADCSGRRLGEGYQQLEGRAQILGPDALRASDLQALPAQVLRTL